MTTRDAYHLVAGAVVMAVVTAASVPWDAGRIAISLVAVVVWVAIVRVLVAEVRRDR